MYPHPLNYQSLRRKPAAKVENCHYFRLLFKIWFMGMLLAGVGIAVITMIAIVVCRLSGCDKFQMGP